MVRIDCYDIKWDTDGEKVNLPKEVTIELEEDGDYTLQELVNEFGADKLSDHYGWCVQGYCWKPHVDKQKRVYITIDGGVLTSVVTDDPDVEVVLCDEDNYRAADDEERAEIKAVHKEIEDGVDKGTLFEIL